MYHNNALDCKYMLLILFLFSVFCCCCFFCRYEWSKFVFILSPRAFCKLQRDGGGGCMGTVETRGDSSHILEEKCFSTTCSSSQTIRLQSVVFPRPCVAHTLAACHVKRTVIHPVEWWVVRIQILQAHFAQNKAEMSLSNCQDWLAEISHPFWKTNTNHPCFELCELLFDGIQYLFVTSELFWKHLFPN